MPTVTGLFETERDASRAVDDLISHGVELEEISIVLSDEAAQKNFSFEVNTKAPEGATTGAVAGGALGAIVSGLTAVGTISLTGGMSLVAAGPVVAAFAGTGAGAVTGGLIGGLIGLGVDENEVKFLKEGVAQGHLLMAVTTVTRPAPEIKQILKAHEAKAVGAL